ncbi:MAG: substrate-binding domain-containing protein [Deltaproteobacteria bacterium]|nr:substrate-binding domain-containing protein [Deltaproteobacteria bacterium]
MRNIAVIAGNFAFPFPVKMLSYINANLKSNQIITRHSTLTKADLEKKRIEEITKLQQPLAVISLAMRPQPESVTILQQAKIPMILIDEEAPGTSTIATDNYRGGYLAGEHLIKQGRKDLAVLCGSTQPGSGYNAINRLKGFRDAIATAGQTLPNDRVFEVIYYAYHEGEQAMNTWINENITIDAVFSAAGDDCASGILRVAQDNKIQVPKDLAIIGYDDTERAQSTVPPLTTIRQPLEEMGKAAYELATNATDDLATNPKTITFQPSLVVRAST